MTRVSAALSAAIVLVWAVPAFAQTRPPAIPGPVTLGGFVGAGAVEKVGALIGAGVGIRWTDRIDVVGEGFWSQNATTRRRLNLATSVASLIQTPQGGTATGSIKSPTTYAGGGVRVLLLDERRWRPYLVVTGGIARIALRPEIVLAGSDITATLPQFGVTLGSDLAGVIVKPAFGGGFGVRSFRGRSYLDLGIRYTSIQTDGQVTSIIGAGGAVGFSL
jgi:hypothetical protein